MALLERLEQHFHMRSVIKDFPISEGQVGFLVDEESLERFIRDVAWRTEFFIRLPESSRVLAVYQGPRQWRELLSNDDPLESEFEPCVGVFVGHPNQLFTFVAEIHGAELYGAERAHLELVRHLLPLGYFFTTVGPPAGSVVHKELHKAGSSMLTLKNPINVSRQVHVEFSSGSEVEELWHDLHPLPDFLLAHTVLARFLPRFASSSSIPLVWWLHEFGDRDHSFEFLPHHGAFVEWVRDVANCIVVNSLSVKSHHFGEDNSEVHVVGYCIRGEATAQPRRSSPGLFRGAVVGRLEQAKGQHIAILALKELRNQGHRATLDLIGSGAPRDILRLKGLARRLGVEEWINFRGFVEDPEEIYQSLDFVIVASSNEAMGRVPIEAAIRGIPVFFHSLGNFSHTLQDGMTGIEFIVDDPVDLSRKILAWSEKPTELDILTSSAMAGSKTEHNAENYQEIWERIFRSLL